MAIGPAKNNKKSASALSAGLERCGAVAKPPTQTVGCRRTGAGPALFGNVFPIVLPYLDRAFIAAWQENGYDTGLLEELENWPRLSFGNWVGGDRDGHKGVTAATTHQALRKLRLTAVQVQRERCISWPKAWSYQSAFSQPMPGY